MMKIVEGSKYCSMKVLKLRAKIEKPQILCQSTDLKFQFGFKMDLGKSFGIYSKQFNKHFRLSFFLNSTQTQQY